MGTLTEIASSEFYALQIDAQNQHSLSAKNVTISVTIVSRCNAYRNENNSLVLTWLTFLIDCIETQIAPKQGGRSKDMG